MLDLIKALIKNILYPVISKSEYKSLLQEIKTIRGFKSKKNNEIDKFLLEQKLLNKEHLVLNDGKISEIYLNTEKEPDVFDIASTRSRNAYFSHYSALYIHNLTLQIPKQIYVTLERRKIDNNFSEEISQERIDDVFARKPRITNDKRNYKNYGINFINGQFQNKVGIIPFREVYYISDLERTLIDCSVRPFYSGGVTQVLDAFLQAKKQIDTEKLYEYYSKMNFKYPYHTVIGFYLEKAGYSESDYKNFLPKNKTDFYLTYNILQKEYSAKWQLYFPKGF